MECVYSVSNRAGRPRGTRNKRTFERLGKSSSSGQHEQNNAGNVEENAIPQQEAIEKDSSDPGSRSTRLPELRTQMETSQSIEQSFHAPTSAGLIQDIDALDHSFPPNDESLLAMMDPMAGWPLYNDLAGFSTSADILGSYGLEARSPLSANDETSRDLEASAQVTSVDSSLHQMTRPNSSIVGSVCSDTPRQQLRRVEQATSLRPQLMQGSSVQSSNSSVKENLTPASTGATSSRGSSTPICNCLERHTDLLLHFKGLQTRDSLRIDVLLVAARRGIAVWQALVQCLHCRETSEQEVLILTAMSIRSLVRSMRTFCLRDEGNVNSDPIDNLLYRRSDGSTGSRSGRDQVSGGNHRESAHEKSAPNTGYGPAMAIRPITSNSAQAAISSTAPTNLGMYAITGTDRTAVVNIVLLRTLQHIQFVLAGFKQRCGPRQHYQSLSSGGQQTLRQRSLDRDKHYLHTLGSFGDQDEASDFMRPTDGVVNAEDSAGYVLGIFNDVEAMVLALRRDLQAELNPTLNSGAIEFY